MIARQRHISLIFAAQSSRDVDWNIVRQSDTIVFKELGLNQVESERGDIRAKAKRASQAFAVVPKDQRVETAYICDADFEGAIKFTLPSFWSESLSHIYANLDLSQIENQGKEREELGKVIDTETRYLDNSSLDKDILELRQQGYGIKSIAKNLGCTVWRVRKCLNI